MAYEHTVSLLLGSTGTSCDVFASYHVVLDMTQVGNGWTFELWRSDYERSAWDVLVGNARTATRVRGGDWVGLTIEDTLVLLGQVDAAEVHVDRDSGAKLVISGRDILAPAVDSSADPRVAMPDNANIGDALVAQLEPLGIALFVGVDQGASRAAATGHRRGSRGVGATTRHHRQRVGRTRAKPTESVWGTCEKLLRKTGLMAWVAPLEERRMALVVGTPEYGQAPTYAFTLREDDGVAHADDNVLAFVHRVNTQGVPYEVFVHTASGHGDGPDGRYLAQRANGALLSEDFHGGWVGDQLPTVRHWLTAPSARTLHAAEQDADRHLADANRKLRHVEITVQGHGQFTSDGFRLYAIDTTARVRLDAINMDEVMYVDRVEFSGGRQDAMTKLCLHPLGAIQLTPDPEA